MGGVELNRLFCSCVLSYLALNASDNKVLIMHISNGILVYSVFLILLICKVATLNRCES